LDYGKYWEPNTPVNPAFSPNEFAKSQLPEEVIDALEAVAFNEQLDPMASPMDWVLWLPGRPES
jgi:hypothetical protein